MTSAELTNFVHYNITDDLEPETTPTSGTAESTFGKSKRPPRPLDIGKPMPYIQEIVTPTVPSPTQPEVTPENRTSGDGASGNGVAGEHVSGHVTSGDTDGTNVNSAETVVQI